MVYVYFQIELVPQVIVAIAYFMWGSMLILSVGKVTFYACMQFATQCITQWEMLHSLSALLEDLQALVGTLELPVWAVSYSLLVELKVCSTNS